LLEASSTIFKFATFIFSHVDAMMDKEQSERLRLVTWGRKWYLVIRVIEGENDRVERPRETEVLVRTFLKRVLSFAEDQADTKVLIYA
jgi:hypothetical protein